MFFEGFKIGDGPLNPMALIGGITIIIAALLAFVQVDIKKVLAYSTVSQLGYMVMGLGVGAWTAAVFHIFTHAFFKALLFLGAGSVSHSGAHHSFDMKKDMGGLARKMPITFVTFIIGSVALMGIPIGAGFFSKDEIIATAGNNGYTAFMVVGLTGAFLTAAYMTRCIYLTFLGTYRGGDQEAHEHEPIPERVPAMALAASEPMAEAGWHLCHRRGRPRRARPGGGPRPRDPPRRPRPRCPRRSGRPPCRGRPRRPSTSTSSRTSRPRSSPCR